LEARPPFDFGAILNALRSSPGTVLEVVTADEYRRALVLQGQPALLTVRAAGDAALEVGVTAGAVDSGLAKAAVRAVDHIFQAGRDITGVDAVADPVFQRAWQGLRGFRPVQVPSVFETIAWAIIGQQINVAFAAKCKRALAETYGGRLEVDGQRYLLFPTPERIASLADADLLALQFSRQKARYVLALARAVAEGRFDPEGLRALEPEDALQRLMALLGVGRWTAEYVLMRGLGHPDALPAGDVALQRAVGAAYGLGRLATEAEVRSIGERWAPWRSYAAVTWWRSNQVGA
jgi:DNA-3-methyladenine glycosylase II